ncbi:hypothetical protein MMC25_006394 [Agyrium rufum]|nr:hypothetical protein [Agyrium rufum]
MPEESPRRKRHSSSSPTKYTITGESTPASEYRTPRQSTDRRKSRSPDKPTVAAPPRASGEKSKSRSPEKRVSRDGAGAAAAAAAAATEKRRSAASGLGEDPEKPRVRRQSQSPEKRLNNRPVAAVKAKELESTTSLSSSNALSSASLAKLNALNEKETLLDKKQKRDAGEGEGKTKRTTAGAAGVEVVEEKKKKRRYHHRSRKDSDGAEASEKRPRIVSGGVLEHGRGRRGGALSEDGEKKKIPKCCWIILAVVILLLIILIPIGVLVVGKSGNSAQTSSASATPTSTNLNGVTENDIPPSARGTYLDPFTWLDTKDFNTTYTDVMVGGLSIMGLNSTWDDTTKANNYTPALSDTWAYGTMPIRGINLGGWFSLEPFITPSMFNSYAQNLGIVDEYTLTQHLGPAAAAQTLEKHYSTFLTEDTFAEVQAAGFDHVRIPFSYWAVTTYPGDPYVPKISWRYLLRAIEYARKYGLRVNLDLHAVPGSQNGWNHSGRQGDVGWLNGTDGALNGQRALDIHTQLSTFFAQPRYSNVIALYGLVNEPKMTVLPVADVLNWTTSAINIVRQNGIQQTIVFGDGFLGLPNWQGKLQGIEGLVMDAHQYVIFNVDQIAFDHQTKINFACSGWASQMSQSIDTETGYGPTLCGEWSQADTDCATYLNNVNVGSRWTGTLDLGDPTKSVLSPTCPKDSGTCECTDANADPSRYTPGYKQWLMMNAEAQMNSFEIGWGWFYWTWLTETSPQWSWKLGMEAGILPTKTWNRDYNCSVPAPVFSGLPENY